MKGEIKVGKEYPALLDGHVRRFAVVSYDDLRDWYLVHWDDGDEEFLFLEDIDHLVDNYYLNI